jgi:uracil-DNA glycosylase family 4
VSAAELARLEREIVRCGRCPRLREWCTEVARTKRKAFASETYWGKPVPGFGDPRAKIWILGLAPAAHGANRTGRMFTGDKSGEFLYAALHRAGIANKAESVSRDDGLVLKGVWISSAGRCAPPANKPTPEELAACTEWLDRERKALTEVRVILALGGIAWDAALALLARAGAPIPQPRPKFGHGARIELGGLKLLGCYHVSQQNTFTGRLTEPMLDAVFAAARRSLVAARGG